MPIPSFDVDGFLPAGVHFATWQEIELRFGLTPHRRKLLAGLKAALASLKGAGCRRAYVDGSFVTAKEHPGDFDGCWDEVGVDPDLLHPALLSFDNQRARQKAVFFGEMFPSASNADGRGANFVQFFQRRKDTGGPKGIVCIDLTRWNP